MYSTLRILEDAGKQNPFPCPTTYRTALSHYLDITSTPRTNVLKELAEYAKEDKDKEFLIKLAGNTPESKVRLETVALYRRCSPIKCILNTPIFSPVL